MARRLVWGVVCALVVSAVLSAPAHADAASPTVTGPVAGTPLLPGDTAFDLASVGYTRSELFLEGTANAYAPTVPLTSDGKWAVTPVSPQPYKTRVVVNRPIDEGDFNGTVVVEWLNVSGLVDAGPAWIQTHVELIRRGYAWVGVSAQTAGINQLKCPALAPPFCPAAGDPARYGIAQPSRRQLLVRHVLAGGAGDPRRARRRPRRAGAGARDRGRRVAVGRATRHLHRRSAPARATCTTASSCTAVARPARRCRSCHRHP